MIRLICLPINHPLGMIADSQIHFVPPYSI
nr:MAG TPA: hypothetical protein [Caudoviricetes sp.]